MVDPSSAPDLVSLFADATNNLLIGAQTDFHFALQNRGTEPIGSFRADIVYSTDDILGNADDRVLDRVLFETGLAAYEMTQQTVTIGADALDAAWLYARALDQTPPHLGAGAASPMQDAIGVVLRWQDDTLINVNTADGQWADSVTYFPWDLDQDGTVTTADVDTVMDALGQSVGANNAIADLNGDGFITPTDAISVINRLGVQVNPAVVASRDRPDLVSVFVDAQPDYLVDGLTRFTFAVQNQGTAIADTFAVDILFSDNQQMGNVVDEIGLQTVTIEGGLAPGETVEQTVVLQLPTRLLNARTLQQESYSSQGAPGDVSRLRDYLGLMVDSSNTVFESDEVNNVGSLLGQGSDDITMHRWDVDGDGTVSQMDVDLVSAQLGQTVAADTGIDFGFSVGAGFDFDGDGTVTQADVDAVTQRLGYLPNPGTVEGSLPPRPLTLALANRTDLEWITADPTLVGAIDPSLAIAALKVKLNGGSYRPGDRARPGGRYLDPRR